MITFDHLSYGYSRGHLALQDVTASVAPGIHLLLGENGAGKTTLLRMMAGLLDPVSGTCLLDGRDMTQREPSTRKKVFMMPDSIELPAKTIRNFASIHSRFYPTYSPECFDENLKEFGLDGNEVFTQLSLGLRHKSLLAYVTALGVDILLLDEPANGLDISSKKRLRHMLARTTSEGQTVIISTHTVTDLKELYDGVIVLSHGKLLLARQSWEISERISCVNSAIPAYKALFTEQGPGVFHSIVINNTGESTELNYNLLYSALMSPSRDKILHAIATGKADKEDMPQATSTTTTSSGQQ